MRKIFIDEREKKLKGTACMLMIRKRSGKANWRC